MRVEKKEGGYSSYCVWSKGIASLHPKADLVAFFDPEQPDDKRIAAEVKWKEACAICGGLMLDTQMFPPRYYVSAFPTEEQLEALASTGKQ